MNFDIDKYKRIVARLDDHDIDYDRFQAAPLSEGDLRCPGADHPVAGLTLAA